MVPPARIAERQPPQAPQVASLLSRRLIWVRDSASFRHRHFSSIASNRGLFDAGLRSRAKWFRSDTPCSLPAHRRRIRAALQQRSNRRGTCRYRIYGAASQALRRGPRGAATGKISCFPFSRSVSFLCRLRGPPKLVAPSTGSQWGGGVHEFARLSRRSFAAFDASLSCADASGSPT